MIRVKGSFTITGREYPEDILLNVFCHGCQNHVNVLDYFCHYLPDILQYLPDKDNRHKKVELTVRCPSCNYKFLIDGLNI
jgi:hypothetical protein